MTKEEIEEILTLRQQNEYDIEQKTEKVIEDYERIKKISERFSAFKEIMLTIEMSREDYIIIMEKVSSAVLKMINKYGKSNSN